MWSILLQWRVCIVTGYLVIVTYHCLCFRRYYLIKDQEIKQSTAYEGGGTRYALVYLKKANIFDLTTLLANYLKEKNV